MRMARLILTKKANKTIDVRKVIRAFDSKWLTCVKRATLEIIKYTITSYTLVVSLVCVAKIIVEVLGA